MCVRVFACSLKWRKKRGGREGGREGRREKKREGERERERERERGRVASSPGSSPPLCFIRAFFIYAKLCLNKFRVNKIACIKQRWGGEPGDEARGREREVFITIIFSLHPPPSFQTSMVSQRCWLPYMKIMLIVSESSVVTSVGHVTTAVFTQQYYYAVQCILYTWNFLFDKTWWWFCQAQLLLYYRNIHFRQCGKGRHMYIINTGQKFTWGEIFNQAAYI